MEVAPDVFVVRDTCNVYVLRTGDKAVLIDFGSGDVLDHLDELGLVAITDVLMTHHHRDQGQGLARARAAGIRIWVPPVERDLFESLEQHWQARTIDNDYDLRDDRFSLLTSVSVDGSTAEYQWHQYGSWSVFTLPTPGHTVGSVTYLVDSAAGRLAFVGDLIYAPGKVWSLASMQWTYVGMEGAAMTIASLRSLIAQRPDRLLPSHGSPMDDPPTAAEQVESGLQDLLRHRPVSTAHHITAHDLPDREVSPYELVSPHLLMNRTSQSISYALLSDDGVALLFDFGYDMSAGIPTAADRSARRPWLASLPALRRDFGIDRIEVAIPTHYHDDHVAGFNLIRAIEGTQIWASTNVAPILQDPKRYDVPCLWYDPIPVDRTIALNVPTRWREYELTMHELPGHTLYAVAIGFEVDGRTVVATGDQQDGAWIAGERSEYLNYQYRNGFRIDDFVASAHLYRQLAPDLLISGHWAPREVTMSYLDALLVEGEHIARLHRQLLPLAEVDFGAGGFGARIEPYRSRVQVGSNLEIDAILRNPLDRPAEVVGEIVVPPGWECIPTLRRKRIGPRESTAFRFAVNPAAAPIRRARIAVDLTVDGIRFGQQAEALVDVG